MEPFERFKKLTSEGNLWIYVLLLAREETIESELRKSIFEKFGFLPSFLLLKRVVFRLKNEGYLIKERYKGKPAIKITEKGEGELKKTKEFIKTLLESLEKF
jgi:CTP-dependent riboflavin kinase